MSEEVVDKKTHTGVKVLVVLLLMIGCLALGYYLSNSGIVNIDLGKSDNKEVNDKSTKIDDKECEQALDITAGEVIDLYNKMIEPEGYYCGFNKLYVDHKVTVNDLEARDISNLTLSALYKKYNRRDEGSTYTKDEMENVAKELFGKDFNYNHGTIENACPAFTYDEASQTYRIGVHGCGGTCGPTGLKKLVKAVKTTSGIDLYVRVIFIQDYSNLSNFSSSDLKYYSDYAKTKEVQLERDYSGIPIDNMTNLAQGALYKISFELEDGNYVFKSSEEVK